MIFVTVGTHEQPMNRLFQALEAALESSEIQDEVFVQSGYTNFQFKHCKAKPFLAYEEMEKAFKDASVVICHGGPATIMQARLYGKKPIVVPRQKQYGEHINDHQVAFCTRLEKQKLISCVFNIQDLKNVTLFNQNTDHTIDTSPQLETNKAISELCQKLIQYCHTFEVAKKLT